MPTLIDSTIGGATANSYVTLAEANTYFSTRLGTSVWDAADDTDKEKALITAAARLDEDDYVGIRATQTQRLRWPRYNVRKPDSDFGLGYGAGGINAYFLPTEIPQLVEDAQCELAQELLSSGSIMTGELGDLASVKVGDMLDISFKDSEAGLIPSRIAALLRGFRLNTSGVPMVRA